MMLYEAVHLQQSEAYYDYTSPQHKMKERERDRVKVQRTKSFSNVQRFINQQQDISRRGSYVVGQKLRESKWFNHDELKVFCAVVETGFIVQRKDDINDVLEFGLAVWNTGEEKSKNPDLIKIYSLQPYKNNFRVGPLDLLNFWPTGTKLRIYNHCDKTETPHSEDVIRNQIVYAEATKQKWHNSEHFTYWCRYGPIQINQRMRNMLRKIGQAMSLLLILSGKGIIARDVGVKLPPAKRCRMEMIIKDMSVMSPNNVYPSMTLTNVRPTAKYANAKAGKQSSGASKIPGNWTFIDAMTDAKWGSFGLNSGLLLIKKRIRRLRNAK